MEKSTECISVIIFPMIVMVSLKAMETVFIFQKKPTVLPEPLREWQGVASQSSDINVFMYIFLNVTDAVLSC